MHNILDYIILNFTDKEIKLYRMRKYMTLEEVGKEFGVTRERVRNIEDKVKEKARDYKLEITIKKNEILQNTI